MTVTLEKNGTFKHRSLVPGTCLITELAQTLCSTGTALSDIHVVLPTQRLQVYLTQEILRIRGGASVLPRLWTWDRFLENLIADFYDMKLVMVSSQAELIMDHVLRQRQDVLGERPSHTNPRHAHELVHLAGELQKSDAQSSAQGALQDFLARDWRRSEDVYRGLSERIQDVFDSLKAFEESMAEQQWVTTEEARCGSIKKWLETEEPEAFTHLPRGPIIMAGLTSLPPIEVQLLKRVAGSENVSTWLDEPPPHSQSTPLALLRSAVGMSPNATTSVSWALGVKKIYAAPDITHEVLHVLKEVKGLLDGGTPAHEIGVIIPEEKAYAPAFKAFSERLGIPCNMPLATPWAASPVARWLKLVATVSQENEIHSMGQYVLHPMTRKLFDAQATFDEKKFQEQLKYFPEVSHVVTEVMNFVQREFDELDASYIEHALTWATKSEAQDIDAARNQLTEAMAQLMPEDGRRQLSPREQSSWNILSKAIDQVCALAPLRGYKSTGWTRFLADIYQTANQQSTRDTGEPLHGVQVIGLTEARYVPFAAAFIVGCVEGSFPHALPRDSLIDNSMRHVMGLPGWHELESLEDTTFHLLTSRLPHVVLSFSHADGDSPTIRSRWIEQLSPRLSSTEIELSEIHDFLAPAAPAANELAQVEVSSESEGFAADHESLTATTSASRLRSLIWCPYRYLMDARRLVTVELPEDRAQIKAGLTLHRVLEAFFKVETMPGLPQDLVMSACPAEEGLFTPWAHRRLDALSELIVPKEFARTALFQHMTGRGWRDVAEFWRRLFAAGWHPQNVETEVKLGSPTTIKFKVHDRIIEVHGTIDAIHHPGQRDAPTLITDYKTSSTPSSTAIAQGLEPQLVLYAEAIDQDHNSPSPEKSRLDKTVITYYSLSAGKPSFVGVGKDAKDHLAKFHLISSYSKFSDLGGALNAVRERWHARLSTIAKTSSFAADPSDCGFCSYQGICRKNDPRYKDRIAQQKIAKPAAERNATKEADVDTGV